MDNHSNLMSVQHENFYRCSNPTKSNKPRGQMQLAGYNANATHSALLAGALLKSCLSLQHIPGEGNKE